MVRSLNFVLSGTLRSRAASFDGEGCIGVGGPPRKLLMASIRASSMPNDNAALLQVAEHLRGQNCGVCRRGLRPENLIRPLSGGHVKFIDR